MHREEVRDVILSELSYVQRDLREANRTCGVGERIEERRRELQARVRQLEEAAKSFRAEATDA